ncbi:RNA polymerase sigma factor [Enhygromyxa salina]|uniref:ECF RNA polymerase sigma-E factor n=1 Tax=Enhygromyxa salina TaxID=215803 RepID=A0A2S9YRW3_9BACT|nr:sigma-70 family RNA polymerase sigma factor [Enhygromyxa salina]PRQ07828.1 ECF RNA polymerase sigma-E factor [Enhygromyxa salina]
MAAATDAELLDRWRGGDMQAGDTLAGRYFMAIRSYFLNKAPAEHEDLVQETFMRLSSKRDSYRGASSFRVFLFGVARMILLEHLRAKQRAGRFDPMEHSVADVDGGRMSSLMAKGESHRMVLDALRELPLADQELLELYFWQKLTAGEIAELQGLPEPTVRSRVRSALKRVNGFYAKLASSPPREPVTVEGWLGELRDELENLSLALQV